MNGIEVSLNTFEFKKEELQLRYKIRNDNSLEENETLLEEIFKLKLSYIQIVKGDSKNDLVKRSLKEFKNEIVEGEETFLKETLLSRVHQIIAEFKKTHDIDVPFFDLIITPLVSGKTRLYSEIKNDITEILESSFNLHSKIKDSVDLRTQLHKACRKISQEQEILEMRIKIFSSLNLRDQEILVKDLITFKTFYVEKVKILDDLRRMNFEHFHVWMGSQEGQFVKATLSNRSVVFDCDALTQKVLKRVLSKEVSELNKEYSKYVYFISSFTDPFTSEGEPYVVIKKEMLDRVREIYESADSDGNAYNEKQSGKATPETVLLSSRDAVPKPTKREFLKLTLQDCDEITQHLAAKVVGQATAYKKIGKVLQIAAAGLANPKRPIVNIMFAGPTGVGKTEIVKVLAQKLPSYDFTRIDLNLYKDRSENTQLFGSKRGYHDSEKGGELTNAFRKNPLQVILFDEAEKAHPEILDSLLSLMDEGYLMDPISGEKIDCTQSLIFFTTNVGTEGIPSITKDKITGYHSIIKERAKKVFKPEFLGRLDFVVFNSLNMSDLHAIVEINLKELSKEINFQLSYSEDVIAYFMEKAKEGGVRKLKTKLHDRVRGLVAQWLLLHQEERRALALVMEMQGKKKKLAVSRE